MIGVLMPEYVLARMLRTIIEMLRTDLNNNQDANTILYSLYKKDEEGLDMNWNFSKFFNEMKAMIMNEDNLSINFGYNPKAANNLALHILLPSESGEMCIGADEGYQEEDVMQSGELVAKQSYYTQTFSSTYQIMITGTNGMEVLYTYHILKSMFLMLIDQMELFGLRTPAFSGNDIVMQDDLAPVPIFHKVLNITLKYEHNVPKLTKDLVAKNFYFTLHAVEK